MSGKRSKARRRRRRRVRKLLVRFGILAIIVAFLFVFFQLKTVYVNGSLHDQPSAITALILEKPVLGNTLLAKLMNTKRTITSEGFVDSIDVKILSQDTVKVYVKERDFVGCVEAGGLWWYFDSAGNVMAKAQARTEGEQVPPVEGLSLNKDPETMAVLPITNTKVFSMLGVLHQLVTANAALEPDKAVFDVQSNMTLYYGDVQVTLGSGEKLEMRLKKLEEVLPTLRQGYAGTLHLETYDGSQSGLIFDKA